MVSQEQRYKIVEIDIFQLHVDQNDKNITGEFL